MWKVCYYYQKLDYLLIQGLDDFEVSIFLTETSTRHSLLTKQKNFRAKQKEPLKSNTNKITGATTEDAIQIDDVPALRTEESEEDGVNLADLPPAEEEDSLFVAENPRRSKRSRTATNNGSQPDSSAGSEPSSKRRKDGESEDEHEPEVEDDKKKMAMDTSYDGFAIYGRVLCLVVKRRDTRGRNMAGSGGGQAMMEDWIASTQMPLLDEDD